MANSYIKLFGEDKINIDYDNITEELIHNIAKSILNKHVIVVKDKEFRICEIEFYIKTKNHNDEYTHCDNNQKLYGKWYFHKYRGTSYKSGTYKGLDLTLGNGKIYFGILIRAIYNEDDAEFICGPCNSVNRILKEYNKDDVKEFMEDKHEPLSARRIETFHIKRKHKLKKLEIFKGSRIGLSDKYPDFRYLPYRFLTMKKYTKKQKRDLVLLNETYLHKSQKRKVNKKINKIF